MQKADLRFPPRFNLIVASSVSDDSPSLIVASSVPDDSPSAAGPDCLSQRHEAHKAPELKRVSLVP